MYHYGLYLLTGVVMLEEPKQDMEQAIVNINTIQNSNVTYWHAFQKISRLSWQMSASYSFSLQMAMLVYLLGQLNDNDEHLAAITLITSLLNSVVIIGAGPLLGVGLVAGKELGELRDAQKNGESEEALQLRREHIAAAFGNALIISLVMSPLMLATTVSSKPLFNYAFNQNEEVAEIAAFFVTLYSVAIPGIMIRISADQILFTFEHTKTAMIVSLVNLAIGMSVGSILAFGAFGAPKMGPTGLLIGCILDPYLSALSYLVHLSTSSELSSFHFLDLYKSWQPYLNQLIEMSTFGGSILLNMTAETTMSLIINAFAGIISVQQQAAFSAIMQFSLFSYLLQIAFGQTCAQEMSRNLGEHHFYNASIMGKMGIIALLSYITPVLIFLSAFPETLCAMMGNNNHSLAQILQKLAPIMFVGCTFDALRFVLLQELRILGDDKRASVISMGCIALGIALAGTLGLQTEMGVYGVATGFTASTSLAAAILLTRWASRIGASSIEKHQKNNPTPETLPRLSFFGSSLRPSFSTHKPSPSIEMSPISPMHSATSTV